MRWDDLFNDLEAQLERESTADETDLRAEEERLRLARLGLRDRLLSVHASSGSGSGSGSGRGRDPDRGAVSGPGSGLSDRGDDVLRLTLRDGSLVAVTPSTFGRDWFTGDLQREGSGTTPCVVPLAGIASVALTRAQVYRSLAPEEGERSLSARLGLGFLLRDLCRRRTPLALQLVSGTVHGTIDRVGRDHCDLAVHDAGGIRRESLVTEFRVVPFSELLLVRL
ncbi:hypothetical protein B0I08_103155 [Glaciihabitans tibetensis]|uniref:Uncharacterized protein n=1 Tax=Glaciihabitans tibetensis TaxID=1266600 RepID=A0A2T0VFG2_9MICO|nr:hypothetical protein [Glaciihabitans tibetensis]PRY68950.1 hypothetical protein B0I08_103155 [Glaciihabitans tibetensis]